MLGVDVGGTFTDVVAVKDGKIITTKVPTEKVDTDNAQHAGLLSKYGIDPSDITDKLGGLGKLL